MPIIPDDNMQYALDRVDGYIADGIERDASFKEKLTSAFRAENTVMSYVSQNGDLPDGYADSEYDVFSKLTEEEKLNSGFVNIAALADNDLELNSVRDQYRRELEDKEKLGGADGFAAMLMSGIVDPVNLIPVGGAATKAYKSGNILKGGLLTGAAAVGATSAAELGLHATQLTRTKDESLLNVTGAMLLGGALGSGVAALNKNSLSLSAKEIEDTFESPMVNTTVDGGSVGAASVWGDVRVKGKNVEKALSVLKPIDPLARVMTSSSKASRKYGAMLVENPLEIEGFTGRSVEQLARTKHQAYFGRALNGHSQIFVEAKKGGFNGKRGEFNILTSREIANPNSTGNKYARKAAAEWDKHVYSPIAKELQELNLLGDDLDVSTAQKYLNRRWDKSAVSGNLNEFNAVVSKWLKETQPDIEDADELANEIAMRIMGTPDGMIRYDQEFKYGSKSAQAKQEPPIDPDKLEGIQVDEKVRVKETGETIKVKSDAKKVYNTLSKQKDALLKLRECLNA